MRYVEHKLIPSPFFQKDVLRGLCEHVQCIAKEVFLETLCVGAMLKWFDYDFQEAFGLCYHAL